MSQDDAPSRRAWWREPLLHFLVVGAVLYGLDTWRDAQSTPAEEPPIVVSAARVDALAASLKTAGKPEPEALQRAIDALVTEEALLREAHRLGLDRGDLIVRRRLLQKMEFLIEDLAAPPDPAEADLKAWLAEHPEAYRSVARTTFEHIYFSRDRHAGQARKRAVAMLEAGPESGAGDPFLHGRAGKRMTPTDVARRFGKPFALALDGVEPGGWRGPIASAFGEHLVRVEAREGARTPALSEVRAKVLRDVRAARRKEAAQAARGQIRGRYRVVVEGASGQVPPR